MKPESKTERVTTVCPAHCGIEACGILAHVDSFFKYTGASYDPSTQGAIASIDYVEDGRITSDSLDANSVTLPVRAALEQNDSVYVEFLNGVIQSAPFPAPWLTFSSTGIVASMFARVSCAGPGIPDFTDTGSEIHFGYVRANFTGYLEREITEAIDNWMVTINAPATAGQTTSVDFDIGCHFRTIRNFRIRSRKECKAHPLYCWLGDIGIYPSNGCIKDDSSGGKTS